MHARGRGVWMASVSVWLGGMHGQGGMHGRGGMCGRGHTWPWGGGACVAGEMATAATSTHPSGMHSC